MVVNGQNATVLEACPGAVNDPARLRNTEAESLDRKYCFEIVPSLLKMIAAPKSLPLKNPANQKAPNGTSNVT